MDSGDLVHKVTIQRAVEVKSASGARSESYVDWLVDIWAEVLPLTPREFWQAQQVQSEITAKIRIRYRPGLDAKMRVRHQRQPGSPSVVDYYDIEGPPVEVKGRRTEVWLMAKKRDAEGFRTGERS